MRNSLGGNNRRGELWTVVPKCKSFVACPDMMGFMTSERCLPLMTMTSAAVDASSTSNNKKDPTKKKCEALFFLLAPCATKLLAASSHHHHPTTSEPKKKIRRMAPYVAFVVEGIDPFFFSFLRFFHCVSFVLCCSLLL